MPIWNWVTGYEEVSIVFGIGARAMVTIGENEKNAFSTETANQDLAHRADCFNASCCAIR